mmetsp:Transcript_20556/g.32726  ORF Transcript_20556/g.32726 Transcript_20556/m.32726 type:complete len:229 (-) Transcript_20556:49-735(-)
MKNIYMKTSTHTKNGDIYRAYSLFIVLLIVLLVGNASFVRLRVISLVLCESVVHHVSDTKLCFDRLFEFKRQIEGRTRLLVFRTVQLFQIRMAQTLQRRVSVRRIHGQHHRQQFQRAVRRFLEHLLERFAIMRLQFLNPALSLRRFDPGQVFGSAHHFEDDLQLIEVVLSGKQRATQDQLGEDTAQRPNVHAFVVETSAAHYLWRAVPTSHHVLCRLLDVVVFAHSAR